MSFLLDLIGSAAAAGSKGIGEYQEQERALERQREAEKGTMNRAVELEKIRGERAEAERMAKMKRMSEQTQDVEAKARVEGDRRQLSAAQRMAPSVDANVLEVIKSKLTPEQMEKFYGVKDNALSRADDQIAVARREGYYDLEEQLKSAREATRKAIADEFKAASDTRRLDQMDRRLEETEADNKRRHMELMAKGSPGGGNTTFDRQVEILRKAGRSDSEIADFITDRKSLSVQDLAVDLYKSAKKEGVDMTYADAVKEAKGLIEATKPPKPIAVDKPRADQFKVVRPKN